MRFTVNGKVDSSLSAGARRYYQEMDYTFHHHDDYDSYDYQAGVSIKQLDASADKTVSLIKTLY